MSGMTIGLMMFAVLLLLIFVPQLSLVLLKTPGG